MDRSVKNELSGSSSLMTVHDVNDGICNPYCAFGSHALQTAAVNASQTPDHRCTQVHFLAANDMKLPDFSDSENKTDFLFQTVKTTTYV
jgi:hypothetical protein